VVLETETFRRIMTFSHARRQRAAAVYRSMVAGVKRAAIDAQASARGSSAAC
jgi:hypothetical protein